MGKVVKNVFWNFAIILVIFSLVTGWMFSGWPELLEFRIQNIGYRVPPEIQEAHAAGCTDSGGTLIESDTKCRIVLTSGSSFTVPDDWDSNTGATVAPVAAALAVQAVSLAVLMVAMEKNGQNLLITVPEGGEKEVTAAVIELPEILEGRVELMGPEELAAAAVKTPPMAQEQLVNKVLSLLLILLLLLRKFPAVSAQPQPTSAFLRLTQFPPQLPILMF